jgi:serine/threonine protein kinase
MSALCPPQEQLERLVDDRLETREDAALTRHVESCAACQARLERLLAGSLSTPSPAPATPEMADALLLRLKQRGRSTPTVDYPGTNVQAGTVIAGKYTLLERVGEGGMGAVWRARQTEPVKRFVAVKLIKAGMDSRQVLSRFEAERQALALMDHPNIAKVHDGGLHEQRPFFVMELVKGVPITEYCDRCKLTPKQRLELFVPVCAAIQHAHQKGIIHRDIKPSNVLVALYDDRPMVKVIDFGVAKATGAALTEQTLDTGFGGVVGTPEYMSPEQATLGNLDIDTRSDVYALGVLLYELLTGSPPFSRKDLEKKGLPEMLRVVREEEPPWPSAKLSTADGLKALSANRGTEPKKLTSLLSNELDWIVMKALEKDRTRRYETANGFAADVNRYLAGEPVLAHPPSTAYRLRKFVRRHRPQVIAASLVLLALLAGIVGTTWGLIRAEESAAAERQATREALTDRAKALDAAKAEAAAKLEAEEKKTLAENAAAAERAAKLEAESQKQKAEEEKAITLAVKFFLQEKLLGQADVRTQANALLRAGSLATRAKANPTIRELLDRAAEELTEAKIEANFPRQPLVQADILQTVGNTYRGVGEFERALGYLQRALALRQATLGPEHPDTLISMGDLAMAYHDAGKRNLALPLIEETFKLRKATLGLDHPDTLFSMNNLAEAYREAGKLDLALPLGEETLQLQKAKLGPEHPHTLQSMNDLACGYLDAGKRDLALPLFEQTLKLRQATLGPEHPDTLRSMSNLAAAYRAVGKRNLALPLFEETLKLRQAKLGPDHPDTLTSMHNLAVGYTDLGKFDLALPLLEETLKLRQAKLGPDHPDTLSTMNNLAEAYWWLKRLDQSIPLFEKALQLQEKRLGRQHPDTLLTVAHLGVNYKDAGRLQEAMPLLEEAYRDAKKYPDLRFAGGHLLLAYAKAGERAKLANLVSEQLHEIRNALPKDSPQLAGQLAPIGLALLEQQQWAEAEPLLRECLTIREKTQPDAWTTFNTMSLLGGALLGQKKYAEAEPLLLKGYEGMKQREETIPPPGKVRLPEAAERLVQLYEATDKKDETARWRSEQERYTGKLVGPVHEVGTGLELKGQLDAQTPALAYQVKFVAGKTYVIDMVSPDQKALNLYLYLHDATGKKLAEDNDSGAGRNARIVFRAEQDGTYRIGASSFNAGSGAFTLTVREQPKEAKGQKN